MGELRIRRGVAGDARALAGLRWDCKTEDTDPDPSTREGFVDRYTTWFSDAMAGDWAVIVAEEGLRLCGHVFVRVVDKPPSPLPGSTAIGYVTNFYVVPERRGEGIGGRLLTAMREWTGTIRIDALVVWPTDLSVMDYERAGFRGGSVLQLPID